MALSSMDGDQSTAQMARKHHQADGERRLAQADRYRLALQLLTTDPRAEAIMQAYVMLDEVQRNALLRAAQELVKEAT